MLIDMDLIQKLGLMLVVEVSHTAAAMVLQRDDLDLCKATDIGRLEAVRAKAVALLGIQPGGDVVPVLEQLIAELVGPNSIR